MNSARTAKVPNVWRSWFNPVRTCSTTSCARPRWKKTPPMITTACVATKARKIGTSVVTDSFTPRRFITVSAAITATSVGSLRVCKLSGRLEKTASPPDAIEVVMVRM